MDNIISKCLELGGNYHLIWTGWSEYFEGKEGKVRITKKIFILDNNVIEGLNLQEFKDRCPKFTTLFVNELSNKPLVASDDEILIEKLREIIDFKLGKLHQNENCYEIII